MTGVRATSVAAKRSMSSSVSKRYKKVILEFLIERAARGATLDEMQLELGIKLQTLCARRKELENAMMVIDSGLRRPTSSGRTATVWTVPDRVRERAIERGWKR